MAKNKTVPEFDGVMPWGAYRPSFLVRALLKFGQMMPKFLGVISKVTRHPVKYWSNSVVDLVIWGLKLRLNPRGNMSEQKLYSSPRGFDPVEMRYMEANLKNGGVFIDIGANAGIYSFWAYVCSGGRAKVLGFEPDVEMRRRIEFNIASNKIDNITIFPYALSDKEGTAEFWVNEGQRGTNSLVPPIGKNSSRHQVQVQIRTLSDVLLDQEITKIDVMKIDIEGHEPPVLRHFFANAPTECWPTLLIGEVQHLPVKEIETMVPQKYYKIIAKTELNTIWTRRQSQCEWN